MWDAIEANRRRSWLLIGAMGAILLGLGSICGAASGMSHGWFFGMVIAVGLWVVLWVLSQTQGDQLLLLSAGAHEISRDDSPRLWNVVEEMTIASGLGGKLPRVFIVDSDIPNAFAVGRDPEKAAVAVTSGLLRMLNRDELQGVIAHEIGHIKNQDVRFMTTASVMLGAIILLSDGFLKYTFLRGARRRISPRGGPQVQIALMIAAVVAAILAPIVARMLYFACSRKREFLADASAAQFTRYPDGLASALEKIEVKAVGTKDVGRVIAPLYIVNPLQARAASGLMSTHPPTENRVKILRSMGGRAGFIDYEKAYRSVQGGDAGRLLGLRTLSDAKSVAARQPSPEEKKAQQREDTIQRVREVADIIDRLADYVILTCMCGVRIKLPPGYQRPSIDCPRCGVNHPIPGDQAPEGDSTADACEAEDAVAPEETAEAPDPNAPAQYQREGAGWEAFECQCGRTLQLSPSLSAPVLCCPKCRRRIEILPPEPEPEPEAAESTTA